MLFLYCVFLCIRLYLYGACNGVGLLCAAMPASSADKLWLQTEHRWSESTSVSSTTRPTVTQSPGRMEGKRPRQAAPQPATHANVTDCCYLNVPQTDQPHLFCCTVMFILFFFNLAVQNYNNGNAKKKEKKRKTQLPPQTSPPLIRFAVSFGPILEFSAQFPEKSNKALLVHS